MSLFLHHIGVFFIFLSVAGFAWLHGGTQTEALLPTIPWLLFFLFETLLCFPQRHPYEAMAMARARVWHDLKRDPLLYMGGFLLLLLLIPFVNRAHCLVCDAQGLFVTRTLEQKPPLPGVPFCVNGWDHLGVVIWLVPLYVGTLAVRHALTRQGKRLLLELIVWNSALLALFGFIQLGTGAERPFWGAEGPKLTDFFSTFGYSNMAGAYFTMSFAFALGLWQHRVSEVALLPAVDRTNSLKEQVLHRVLRAHYPILPAALCFFGALCTYCRTAIIGALTLAVLVFLYYATKLLFDRRGRAKNVWHLAYLGGGTILFILLVSIFAPDRVWKEWRTLNSGEILDRVSNKNAYHSYVSVDVLKDHLLFGVGGWGYKHFSLPYFHQRYMDLLLPASAVNEIPTVEEGVIEDIPVTLPSGAHGQASAVVVDRLPEREEEFPLAKILQEEGAGVFVPNQLQWIYQRDKYKFQQSGFLSTRNAEGLWNEFPARVSFWHLKEGTVVDLSESGATSITSLGFVLKKDGAVQTNRLAGVVVERQVKGAPTIQAKGGANVHNDYLQFLCEHGLVGGVLLFGSFLCLVIPIFQTWGKLYRTSRFVKNKNAPPPPRAIYCFPAGAFWIVLGNVTLIVHAFGDCPMRSGAVLMLAWISLACATGYFPRTEELEEDE